MPHVSESKGSDLMLALRRYVWSRRCVRRCVQALEINNPRHIVQLTASLILNERSKILNCGHAR